MVRPRTHGMTHTRLYRTWADLKIRCYNDRCVAYARYGGRGIKVCEEWLHDFKGFMSWSMSNGYTDELQIDRIDGDGNYEPSNCRFVTCVENIHNKKSNKLDMDKALDIRKLHQTKEYTLGDIAKIYNVSIMSVSLVIRNKTWKI